MPLRFLQLSDLHLDSSLTGGRLGLPPQKRAKINKDMINAMHRAVNLAKRTEVDCLLVPGDLWDDESVSFQTATQLFDAFASLAPVPVIIAPGNHDAYHAFSYHHPAYYLAKTGKAHPGNVHIFTTPDIRSMHVPELPGITFYGCCYTENRPRTERILAGVHPQGNGLHILLLHGSQDDAVAGYGRDKMMAAPFSRLEILEAGFDYTALGHYHRFSLIDDHLGRIRAAYGGIPVARGLDEGGERYVLLGEIESGGIEPEAFTKEFLDTRQILKVPVPIDSTIVNEHAARLRLEEAFEQAGVAADDMVYAQLEGRTHPEIDHFDFDPAWQDAQCFHLAIDQNSLEPEYELGSIPDETADKRVESRFARQMKTILADPNTDARSQRVARMALYLGLDALHGREVKPRRVY